jgi:hypothetical protein
VKKGKELVLSSGEMLEDKRTRGQEDWKREESEMKRTGFGRP